MLLLTMVRFLAPWSSQRDKQMAGVPPDTAESANQHSHAVRDVGDCGIGVWIYFVDRHGGSLVRDFSTPKPHRNTDVPTPHQLINPGPVEEQTAIAAMLDYILHAPVDISPHPSLRLR